MKIYLERQPDYPKIVAEIRLQYESYAAAKRDFGMECTNTTFMRKIRGEKGVLYPDEVKIITDKLKKPLDWAYKEAPKEETIMNSGTSPPGENEQIGGATKGLVRIIESGNDVIRNAILSNIAAFSQVLELGDEIKELKETVADLRKKLDKTEGEPPGTGIHRAGNDED